MQYLPWVGKRNCPRAYVLFMRRAPLLRLGFVGEVQSPSQVKRDKRTSKSSNVPEPGST